MVVWQLHDFVPYMVQYFWTKTACIALIIPIAQISLACVKMHLNGEGKISLCAVHVYM